MWLGLLALFFAGVRLLTIWGRGREPSGRVYAATGVAAPVGIHREKGRISGVNIAVDAGVDLSFTMYREGWFDGIAKSLGIVRELQTGDVPFDGRIFVQSEDPALHAALTANKELRNHLFNLMGSNAREISVGDRRLWVVTRAYNELKEREDADVVRRVAGDLLPPIKRLLPELAKIRGAGGEDARDRTRAVRRGIAQAIAVCFAGGVLALLYTWVHLDHQIVRETIVRTALGVTAGAVTALVTVLALMIGASAFTHRVVLDILIAALPATWIAAFGGALWINQQLDPSVSRRVTIPVQSAYVAGSKKNEWYLRVAGWPDPRADHTVELARYEYELISSAPCIDVSWREGSLGDGWVERYQRSESCSDEVEK